MTALEIEPLLLEPWAHSLCMWTFSTIESAPFGLNSAVAYFASWMLRNNFSVRHLSFWSVHFNSEHSKRTLLVMLERSFGK